MKHVSILILAMILAACVPQNKSVIKDRNTSSNLSTSTFTFDDTDFDDIGRGSGTGSGSGTVITPGSGSGSGSSSDEMEEFCGKLYRSKNGYFSFINDDDGKYYVVYGIINNAKQVLDSLIFPNDSYQACLWGDTRRTSSGFVLINILDASFVQLESPLAHPERATKADMYAYDLCGTIQYVTDPGASAAHLQINTSSKNYILKDTTSGKQVEASLASKSSVKGCVYSNKAPYYDYTKTFRPYLDAQDLNVGW